MAFAIAMAWVEAASVFYIRALVDRIEPYQADPMPLAALAARAATTGALLNVELCREAATLVMIAALGVLAGRTWRVRAGYAAVEMARQADLVIVVGGRSSNNTRELVKTCSCYCAVVHHVQTGADVRPEWFDAARVVGLTAGTSTPDDVIDRVEGRIRLYADADL